MRTNIDIDDALLEQAMRATGQDTKRATVEEALRRVVTTHRRRQAIAGTGWDGDLKAMRTGQPG
jgi:Arc/MetJ family transcription regulator